MQPGRERRVAAERADLPEELEKDLLRQVFRFGNVLEHAQAEAVDVLAMSLVEALKGRAIAVLRANNCFALIPL